MIWWWQSENQLSIVSGHTRLLPKTWCHVPRIQSPWYSEWSTLWHKDEVTAHLVNLVEEFDSESESSTSSSSDSDSDSSTSSSSDSDFDSSDSASDDEVTAEYLEALLEKARKNYAAASSMQGSSEMKTVEEDIIVLGAESQRRCVDTIFLLSPPPT